MALLIAVGGCGVEHCPPYRVEVAGYCVRDTDAAVEGAPCAEDRDCQPAIMPGTCDAPAECRGSQPRSTCVQGTCGTIVPMRDDSACSSNTESNDCGAYRSVFCNGATVQMAPICKKWCESNFDCDDDARCVARECVRRPAAESERTTDVDADDSAEDAGAEPIPEPMTTTPAGTMTQPSEPPPMKPMPQPDAGAAPPPPSEPEPPPESLCTPPECCTSSSECGAPTSNCDDPRTCTGTRVVPACDRGRCTTRQEQFSAACDGVPMHEDCGLYRSNVCGQHELDDPASFSCRNTCASNDDCSVGAVCISQSKCYQRCESTSECEPNEGKTTLCCKVGDLPFLCTPMGPANINCRQ